MYVDLAEIDNLPLLYRNYYGSIYRLNDKQLLVGGWASTKGFKRIENKLEIQQWIVSDKYNYGIILDAIHYWKTTNGNKYGRWVVADVRINTVDCELNYYGGYQVFSKYIKRHAKKILDERGNDFGCIIKHDIEDVLSLDNMYSLSAFGNEYMWCIFTCSQLDFERKRRYILDKYYE